MFGGDSMNPLCPVSMDNVRLPYSGNPVPPMPLDVLIGCNADIMNMAGGKNASLANQPMKLGKGTPVFSQHKLPVMVHDGVCLDGARQSRSILKQIPVSTGLKLSYGDEDHNSSISTAGESTMANLPSLWAHSDDLQREVVLQNDEFNQYLRIQEDIIKKGIGDLKHRHTVSLLNALEKEISSKLQEKDVEIDNLNRRNKELTEKIKQIAAEAQSWHYRAKQNESLVNVLRSNINQVFLQGAAFLKEGCGDNMMDDAVSSSNHNSVNPLANPENPSSMKESITCKACKGKEVSVLLLPCRHLCICTECDAFADSCPVCRVTKTGSLQVYMS